MEPESPGPVGAKVRSGRRGEAPAGLRTTESNTFAFERCQCPLSLEERLERGTLWQDNGLVFPSSVGTPISGGTLNRAFKSMLQRTGLPKSTRFHDLRHTCATLLLKEGVNPQFVQELLGHADISLTLNVYGQVLLDMGDALPELWTPRLDRSQWYHKAPAFRRGSFTLLQNAGLLGARLEGFEPPTRGLGNRCSIP